MTVKKLKYLVSILLVCGMTAWADFPTPTTTTQNNFIPSPPNIEAKSYILTDYLSDYVIAELDADVKVEPASLTKMMTIYVVDQALLANKIKSDDLVRISETAWKTQGSRMFLEVKSEVPVEEIIKGIIIQSGNDASVAIAEHIAGTEDAFAQIMNHYAKKLGMKNTHFMNATGLPNADHYTTARDMNLLAKAIIRDFPETYKIYSQKEFTYKKIKQINRNRLLWQKDWIDGIKTGHTDNAGFCLVASGKQNDMRLIGVVMGADSDKERTNEAAKLLSYGFQFFETHKLYPGKSAIQQARIWMGAENQLDLGLLEDMYVTVSRGQNSKLKADITVEKAIKAPIQEGNPLGKLTVYLDDKPIAEKPIVALKDVNESGFFGRMYDVCMLALHSLWEKVSL